LRNALPKTSNQIIKPKKANARLLIAQTTQKEMKSRKYQSEMEKRRTAPV
jgi:hypothetical protein